MASTVPFGHQQPIVGRDREQEQLSDRLNYAVDGHGSLVLVSGAAGIGKTTLVESLVTSARSRGALILRGNCYDLSTTPPYGPWTEALRDYHPAPGQADGPVWPGNSTELARVGSQSALFEEMRQFFEDLAETQPLLVILEDLHWSDQASMELLRYLARHLAESAILVVATFRDDEITRRGEVYDLLPVLVRESRAQRIYLNPLDEAAVRKLIRSSYELSDTAAERLAGHLMRRSEGNPFFAREILYGLEADRLLRPVNQGWELSDLAGARVPALLRQLIQDRIAQLTPGTRAALQVAAVIGQEMSLDLWGDVASLREAELDRVIAESLEARLLEEKRDRAGLQFRHALLRETLYDSLTLNRRRLLHAQIGQELAKTSNPDPDAVAHHFRQAGDPQAIPWLIQAGWRAERSYAMAIAARHYERAGTMLESDPGSARARGWLRFHCAVVLRFDDRERGRAYLEEVGRIAVRVEDPILAAHSLVMHGMLRAWKGEFQSAIAEMEQATEMLDDVSSQDYADTWRVITELYPEQILADRSMSLGHPVFRIAALPGVNILGQSALYWMPIVGRFRQTVEFGEQYVARIEAATDDELTRNGLCRFAYSSLANAYDMLGEPAAAQRWRRRELAAALLFEDQGNVVSARVYELRQFLIYHTERVVDRRKVCSAAVSASAALHTKADLDDPSQLHAAPLDLLEGRWNKARDVVTGEPVAGPVALNRSTQLISLGFLGREQGEPQIAWEQIREILPEGPTTEPGNSDYFTAATSQRLAISLSLDAGDLEQARSWLAAHDRWLGWSGAVIGRAEGALLWARYYKTLGERQRAHELAEKALAEASNPRRPLALISAHRLLGELASLDSRFVEAGEHLSESLALAEACEAPYEQALSLLSLAELGAITGDADAGWQHLNQVRAICTSLGATPALQRATAIAARLSVRRGQATHPAGLTPREVEVLQHIARGMTNPEAGEALFISSRTVAQHLRSIYNKLGVDSRVEATRFAVEHGLVDSPSAGPA